MTVPQATAVPIVALTANALEQDRTRCMDVMDDYVCKPISLLDMETMLRRWGEAALARRDRVVET